MLIWKSRLEFSLCSSLFLLLQVMVNEVERHEWERRIKFADLCSRKRLN